MCTDGPTHMDRAASGPAWLEPHFDPRFRISRSHMKLTCMYVLSRTHTRTHTHTHTLSRIHKYFHAYRRERREIFFVPTLFACIKACSFVCILKLCVTGLCNNSLVTISHLMFKHLFSKRRSSSWRAFSSLINMSLCF
jgi:hypothetical protein